MFQQADTDYLKIESVKDTMVQNKLCRKLIKRHNLQCADRPNTEFMYSENNQVYFLDTIFNTFQLLYDFNAGPGTQWMIKIKEYTSTPGVDSLFVHVDDTTSITINGIKIKVQYVTYYFHNEVIPGYYYQSQIYERIGDLKYMFNFAPSTSFLCDMNFSDGLRCYDDSIFGLYETGNAVSCDYATVGVYEKNSPQIEVYPNPFSDFLTIKLSTNGSFSYRIVNILGIEILSGMVEDSRIDLRSLLTGIYSLELFDQNGKSVVCKKIIKN
jgi:hypothetical protein